VPFLLGWAMTTAFVLATAPIFRAGSLDAAWHVYQGLAILPDPEWISRARPIILAALAAFLLPASQGIVARLNERPTTVIAAARAIRNSIPRCSGIRPASFSNRASSRG